MAVVTFDWRQTDRIVFESIIKRIRFLPVLQNIRDNEL